MAWGGPCLLWTSGEPGVVMSQGSSLHFHNMLPVCLVPWKNKCLCLSASLCPVPPPLCPFSETLFFFLGLFDVGAAFRC